MQHLRSLFSFLLTILSTLSLTAFPLTSVSSQISAAPLSSKFIQKPVHYLTVTKIKCMWDKYIYIEAIHITSSSGMYRTNILGGPKKKTHPNFNLQFPVNHRFLLRRILYTDYTFYLKSFLKFCERLLLETIKYGMLQKTCDFYFV